MKKTSPKSAADLSETGLEQKAFQHFSAGRYREAADQFKILLKNSNNSLYRQQLAQCYLLRSFNLSGKGLTKEACVLWENYAELTEQPIQGLDAYILWQLVAKNNQKAYTKLKQLTAQQLDENYPDLAICIGFLLLSGVAGLAANLPEDSALLAHFGLAREALDAYRQNQPERLEQALQKLPFRSAFRDFRTLLKAQLAGASSLEQMQTLLDKIPRQSPYRFPADALDTNTQQGAGFVKSLLCLDPSLRSMVARAKTFSNKQTQLLETLQKLQGHLNDKTKFNLAIQYRDLFGTEAAKAFCQGILCAYPAGHKDYLKYFNTDVTGAFEDNRMMALLCENSENSYDAIFYWRCCIDILKEQGAENNKKIAMILKHMADKAPESQAVGLIIESLDYQADDRNSYLAILDFYNLIKPDKDKYLSWLEKSLEYFPDDIDFLVRAAKSAADRKAFKKAANYARALLEIDPVNTTAKQLLFSSHLAHARRLIKTEKNHLVLKEIQAAEQLTVDKNTRRLAELLRGFHVWAGEDKNQGLHLISETLQNLNEDPVNMHFQAFMESSLLNIPFIRISGPLPQCKDHVLSASQLRRLMDLIKYYQEQAGGHKLLHDALNKIQAPVKKSLQKQNFNEKILLDWCQLLVNIERFEWLKYCAALGFGKWKKPIWVFYQIVSEYFDDPGRAGLSVMLRLQNALDDAYRQNDQKTAFLIRQFIERSMGYQAPGNDFEDEIEASGQEVFDIFADLFDHIPDGVIGKIDNKVQNIMLKTDPNRFMADIIRKHGQKIEPKRLAKLFEIPDFLAAVAYIKAAEELQINIGVSFEDIVFRFENNTPQFSLPFFE